MSCISTRGPSNPQQRDAKIAEPTRPWAAREASTKERHTYLLTSKQVRSEQHAPGYPPISLRSSGSVLRGITGNHREPICSGHARAAGEAVRCPSSASKGQKQAHTLLEFGAQQHSESVMRITKAGGVLVGTFECLFAFLWAVGGLALPCSSLPSEGLLVHTNYVHTSTYLLQVAFCCHSFRTPIDQVLPNAGARLFLWIQLHTHTRADIFESNAEIALNGRPPIPGSFAHMYRWMLAADCL